MKIGDKFPLEHTADDRALFIPGEARWHGLIVPPMREEQAEAWLDRMGVYAFHPVKRKVSTIRGKKIVRNTRYLPGYVFARFPGRAIWHRVFASAFVSDAIRLQSGHPGVIRRSDLSGIHAMRSRDEEADAVRANARRQAAMFAPGDRVEITAGPLEGVTTEVVAIKRGKAILRLTMFGSDREAEMELEMLRKGE